MQLTTEKEIKAYYEGKMDGITAFAWWRDGEQFVGSGSRTLGVARANVLRARNEALQQLSVRREVWTH